MSRRQFLGVAGAAAASMTAAACASAVPTVQAPAALAVRPVVGIAQAMSYDPAEVRRQVRSLIELVGGLAGVVHSGDRVVIKTNLTGGIKTGAVRGVAPIDSFITHPEVVRALAEVVREAGAREVTVVESAYEWGSFTQWGYEDAAKAGGFKLLDMNDKAPYAGYTTAKVGPDAFVYPELTVHPILQECDVFMSVPKMKCHASAGITLSMKNLVGMVPLAAYRLNPTHTYRSAIHGADSEVGKRLPRVIVDLNRARPIHFALIDGILSTEGGEGPWVSTIRANAPHMLIAGANPLATDTVGTAAMGYDATSAPLSGPFTHSDNHFALAAERGLGTNRLADIDVRGAPLKDVMLKFRPA